MKKMTADDYSYYSSKYYGHCSECDSIQEGGCEPDATEVKCDYCGADKVSGLETAMLIGQVEIVETEEEADVLFP